jgi:hypothetical protein
MPRYRPTRPFASLRNLHIYHDLTCAGQTQTALASKLGISQRRVSAIARQVRTWVERRLAGSDYDCHPGLRFHYAVLQEHRRLRLVFGPFLRSACNGARDVLESNRDISDTAKRGEAGVRQVRQHPGMQVRQHGGMQVRKHGGTIEKGLDVLNSLAALQIMIARGPFAEELRQCPMSSAVNDAATANQSVLKPAVKVF